MCRGFPFFKLNIFLGTLYGKGKLYFSNPILFGNKILKGTFTFIVGKDFNDDF
jgi:hypothetical protein